MLLFPDKLLKVLSNTFVKIGLWGDQKKTLVRLTRTLHKPLEFRLYWSFVWPFSKNSQNWNWIQSTKAAGLRACVTRLKKLNIKFQSLKYLFNVLLRIFGHFLGNFETILEFGVDFRYFSSISLWRKKVDSRPARKKAKVGSYETVDM